MFLFALVQATTAHACSCYAGTELLTDDPIPRNGILLFQVNEGTADITVTNSRGEQPAFAETWIEPEDSDWHYVIVTFLEPLDGGDELLVEASYSTQATIAVLDETDETAPGEVSIGKGQESVYNGSGGGDCGDSRSVSFDLDLSDDTDVVAFEAELIRNDGGKQTYLFGYNGYGSLWFGDNDSCGGTVGGIDRGDTLDVRVRSIDAAGNVGPFSDKVSHKMRKRMSPLKGCSAVGGLAVLPLSMLAAGLAGRRRRR